MNLTVPELLAALRRALQGDVLPAVGEEHARSQLAGVVDVLAKLERMLAWSPDLLRERLVACDAADVALRSRLAAAGVDGPPAQVASAAPPMQQAELEQAVHAAEQRQVDWIDWLYDHQVTLPPGLADELFALLRGAMRRALIAERQRIPRADFTAMTGTDTPAR